MTAPELSFNDEPDPVAPECRATVDALQRALDGDARALDGESHVGVCAACRERVRAARVLLSVLAAPAAPAPVPPGFADQVLAALVADGRAESRRLVARHRARKVAGWAAAAAVAAAAFLAVFSLVPRLAPNNSFVIVGSGVRPAVPHVAPAPREKPPVPPAPPIRINDEVAKAGQALRDTPKPLTESVAAAPKLFDAFASALRRPMEPVAPMGEQLEPARKSLAELPDAARTGLEPVTGTAQKAFDRLLRDVAALKPKS